MATNENIVMIAQNVNNASTSHILCELLRCDLLTFTYHLAYVYTCLYRHATPLSYVCLCIGVYVCMYVKENLSENRGFYPVTIFPSFQAPKLPSSQWPTVYL